MFSFWLLREYHLAVDAHIFVGLLGSIIEVLATLTFTALGLLLCWSVETGGSTDELPATSNVDKHWAMRGIWVFAFFVILVWARFDEVVVVGLIQALAFYTIVLVRQKPWQKFAIRDIMIFTMLICCGIVLLMNLPFHIWRTWKSLLTAGVVFGLLNLLAYWLACSGHVKTKWLIAIAIPYITLLTIVLCLGRSTKRIPILIHGTLTALVFLPVVLMIGLLLYSHPKPVEIGSGINAIDEIISIGNEIGNISKEPPPYPKNGPPLRPFPKTIAQMKSVVNDYSPMTEKSRSLSDKPTWLSVNYEWRDFDDFEGRIKERSALTVLTTSMLVEGRLAFLENRIDDGLKSFCDAMNLNRQCGSGGLPMNTSEAMSRDHYMIEKFADFQNQLTPEQAFSFAARLLEQSDAYESHDVLMKRRLAWEDRVPTWHQRLALKYLAYRGMHPRSSRLTYEILSHKTQLKLLALQLLIFAHNKTHGELPNSLDDIRTEKLNPLKSDPYSPSQAPLIYRRTDDTLLCLSWVQSLVSAMECSFQL